jgi:dUTP pyrophosphatase
MEIDVKYVVLSHAEGLPELKYMTPEASGLDLRAAIDEPMALKPMERALVPTGLMVAIPEGFEGQVRPRSGMAYKNGITVLNTPGTIDSDYRGEVAVIVINLGSEEYVVNRGDRIAQLVFSPIVRARLDAVPSLDATERGDGGFGHTGNN